MENKKKFSLNSLITIIIIIVLGVAMAVLATVTIMPQSTNVQIPEKPLEVNKKIYDKVTNPLNYGVPVSPDEEGFGRANPFAPYK